MNTDKPTLDQVITYLTHRMDGMTMPGAVRMTTAARDYLVELQAENEKLRGYINDLETQHRTEMCENGYDCVELGKLRAELDAYRNGHCAGGGCAAEKDRDAVLAELEQVKRKRDAIEQDFRAFTKQWWEEANGFPCRFCKFEHSGGCEQKAKHPDDEKPCVGRWFEWRGPKED